MTLKEKLEKGGIRHFDKLIHDQPKRWLTACFSFGARDYPVNVAHLLRNIIWQQRERIIAGEKPPLRELIRTFWYMYIKPTLSRADSLASQTDQYAQLVDALVYMVKDLDIMRYKDIGFLDENAGQKQLGRHARIILFAEKLGHLDFLTEIAREYTISIIALGGQPSVMSTEYFVDDFKTKGVNLRKTFHLFSLVDYDPSGWIARDAFIDNLTFYGISHTRVYDLIHPDALTPDEIELCRYRIPDKKSMRKKNEDWLSEVLQKNYENQKYLQETITDPLTGKEKKVLYGLESEAIATKRLAQTLGDLLPPLIAESEEDLRLKALKRVAEAIKALSQAMPLRVARSPLRLYKLLRSYRQNP